MKARWTAFSTLLMVCVRATALPLYGTVLDAHTQLPIQGASVVVTIDAMPTAFSTQTDATGTFSIDVPAGNATIDVDHAGYFDVVSQSSAPAVSPVVLEMQIQNTVIVTLRDAATGLPVDGTVTARNNDLLDSAQTGLDGSAVFLLPTGSYAVCQSNPQDVYLDSCYDDEITAEGGPLTFTPAEVSGGQSKAISIPMRSGGQISGRLTDRDTGFPLDQHVAVRLFSSAGKDLTDIRVSTSSDGRYTVYGIVPGTYLIGVGADNFVEPYSIYTTSLFGGGDCQSGFVWSAEDAQCDVSRAQPVDVTTAGVTDIDMDLQPGDIVSGTIYDRDTGLPIPQPSIYTCSRWAYGYWTQLGKTVGDANGHYRISHTDVASMTFTTRTRGYVPSYWPSGMFDDGDLDQGFCPFVGYLPLPSASEHYDNLDIYLSPLTKQGRFFGLAQVTSSNVLEYLRPTPATIVVFQADTKAVAVATHTDKNGAYVTLPLPSGSYVVTAYLDDGGACTAIGGPGLPACNDDRTFPSESYPFTLNDGDLIQAPLFWQSIQIFHNSFE